MKININGRTEDIPAWKKYSLPEDICAKTYGGYMLLISPSSGKWIVLDSQCQIEIFKSFMKGLTVSEVMKKFGSDTEEISRVLTQIEGKNFVRSFINDEDGFNLRLYLTNKCNLRCSHCFMYASDALEDELAYDEIYELLERCRNYGCVKVILTGGEVLVRRDFDDILKVASEMGMYVQVLTNGTLWDEQRVRELTDYIDDIQISIDGFNEESNAEIRGKGAFSQAMKTFELFMKYNHTLTSVVVTPTYDALEKHRNEYTEFLRGLSERYRDKNFLVMIQNELLDGRNIKADAERNKRMSETVKEMYEEIYENSELTAFVMNHRGGRIFMNCGYGNLTVSSNGNVYFCGRINDVMKFGNIRDDNFDGVMSLRKSVRKYSSVDYLMPCRDCELKYICGGGCRVKNFPDIVNIHPDDMPMKIFTRKNLCTEDDKENFYRLMIESNKFLME